MNQLEPHFFIFHLPLYKTIIVTDENKQEFLNLMTFRGSINEYQPELKENTTYRIHYYPAEEIAYASRNHMPNYLGTRYFILKCARSSYDMHVYMRFARVSATEFALQKIGQYPSIGDLEIAKIKEYSVILQNDKLKEITKAIGLAAHGVGVGSFVYLRRVFEHLIWEAKLSAASEAGWDEERFKKGDIKEKISLLSHHLPEFLIESKEMYGILSKGIHELSEEECLQYFDVVKVGIELILDEKLELALKKKKVEEAKRRIQASAKGLK